MRSLLPLLLLLPLQACALGTAANIVTAPVKVVGKGVDAVTTSQSEADEKRGKRLRQHEERLGKLTRKRDRELRRCEDGKQKSCEKAAALEEEIDEELETKI